jgi:thiamine kinase-like enzyme
MAFTDFHSRALDFASAHIETWKSMSKSDSSITLLTGNSNKVFLLQTSSAVVPNKLIYRVFGPNEITDKARERSIFSQLSFYDFGPKNLGDCSTERLEEYLEGFRTIENILFHDQKIISLITKEMKKMHYFDMTKVIGNEGNMTEENVLKWRNLIKEKLRIYEDAGKLSIVQNIVAQSTLDVFLEVLPRDSEVVYSHLDPSPINLLYNPDKGKVNFIDYEFSGFSYRSMDFALMLNECQIDFFYDKPPFYRICEELAPSNSLIKEYVLSYGEGKDLWVEIKRSLIASHYVWALWSLAVYSGLSEGYDYLEFGLKRFQMFQDSLKKYVDNGGVEYLKMMADDLFDI